MVILGQDNGGNNPDTRELIFSTQSLIKRTERTKRNEKTNEKLSSSQLQDSISVTSFVKNSKDENGFNHHTYNTNSDHGWVLETQLHRRRVTKDIRYLKHL